MPNPDHAIDIIKTTHSVLPWRLRVRYAEHYGGDWVYVPHAHCRTKREALALRDLLEAAADWTVPPEQWPESVRAAVALDVLAHTESAQIERRAWEAEQQRR